MGAGRDAGGGVLAAQDPDDLRVGVEHNLRTLRVEAPALVSLRLMSAEERSGIPMAEQLGELAALRDEGKIESIGLSNATAAESRRARDRRPRRGPERPQRHAPRQRGRPAALRRARRPLRPLLPDRPDATARRPPTISAVAAKHAATPAQIALAWLLHRDEHVLLIPGTSSVTHLEENVDAGAIALDGEDVAALDRVSRP